MQVRVNEKTIRSFSVTKAGEVKPNPEVKTARIVKSDATAKAIVIETLAAQGVTVNKSALVITEIVAAGQWYDLPDEIFFNHAKTIPNPRKSRNDNGE